MQAWDLSEHLKWNNALLKALSSTGPEALCHAGTLDPEEAKKLERSLDEAGAAALLGCFIVVRCT